MGECHMKIIEIVRVPEIENKFPTPENYTAIKSDIASRGIQEAIVVNPKKELLCGYTRLSIAQELGIDEIPHRIVEIIEKGEMFEYALLDNLRRRQLTKLQVVEYGMELEKLYEGRVGNPQLGTNCPELEKGRTRDLVAEKLSKETGENLSGKTYERLKTIATKAAPEIKEKFNAGELTQQATLEIVKLENPEEQRKVLDEYTKTKNIKQVIAKLRTPIIAEPQPLPEGKYSTIEADPPWSLRWNEGKSGGAQYNVMDLEEIKAMREDIDKLAADDCHLYLWAINPMLPEAFEVMETWGFQYKSLLTWVKTDGFGTGHYFRGSTEHILFGIRGNLPLLVHNQPTHFLADRDILHSKKPNDFYQIASRCSPGPRLRLFARDELDGWTSWGDEL